MKCPRCQKTFTAAPDATGALTCPGCGARLRSKPTSAASPKPRSQAAVAPPPAKAASPAKTPAAPAAGKAAPADSPPSAAGAGLDALMAEIRTLREGQQEILALLRGETGEPAAASGRELQEVFGDAVPAEHPAVRSRRRKSVLIIDDDQQTLAEAVAAMERAEVPVRTAQDGSKGLAAIAEEKPDVIVMELGIAGAMAGKDVINMIKATMDWVDVPIVLHTRLPIENQREARQVHGADELVPKAPGSGEALVARVIALFRKS